MQEFHTKRSFSTLSRRSMLVATLAILVLGPAGFAAAGGVDLIRGWFITVEVDGQVYEVDEADVTIETDGNTATLTIDVGEIDVDAEPGATATVTATAYGPVDGSDSGKSVTVETVNVTSDEIDQALEKDD